MCIFSMIILVEMEKNTDLFASFMKKSYLCSTNFIAIHNKDYSVVKTFRFLSSSFNGDFFVCLQKYTIFFNHPNNCIFFVISTLKYAFLSPLNYFPVRFCVFL